CWRASPTAASGRSSRAPTTRTSVRWRAPTLGKSSGSNDPWAARVRGANTVPRALPKRMTIRSILTALVLCGLGPWASGCAAARVPRPQPGDRVVPQILLGEHPWRAGGAVTLSVCLQVRRPGEAETGFLQMEDVPDG